MFANLDQVIHVATTIVNRLNEACRAPASSIQIGQVFMDKVIKMAYCWSRSVEWKVAMQSLKFEVYAEYCLRNVRSNALFAYLLETNPEFKAFVVVWFAFIQPTTVCVNILLSKCKRKSNLVVCLWMTFLSNLSSACVDTFFC